MNLVYQAEMDGTASGLSSKAVREVPERFAHSKAAIEAWEAAFDKMRQDMRGCIVSEVKSKEREPKEVKEDAKSKGKVKGNGKKPIPVTEEPVEEVPEQTIEHAKNVWDVLAELHPEHPEYA